MRCTPVVLATGLLLLLLAGSEPLTAQRVEAAEPNRGGSLDLRAQDPEVAIQHLHPAEGYAIELFASERDFPIGNPVSLTFDSKGRLWVATMPSYPQRLPDEEPDDKLVILEDRDRDGRADHHTVFAGGLHLPTGFELGDGGVYVAQQPNLVFLADTDGDDRADVRETLLHGFGTEDSHHSISVFTWGPGGGLYFQEGTFHHSQVETPWGPVRLVDAGVFRYEPQRHWLEVFVSYPFANPWGHTFDRWGQSFIADASGGSNYFGTAISGNAPYPMKRRPMKVFTSIVRPTAGCEIVTSRHFPPEAQGNFLINNTIGFQGIKQHRMFEDGSGFSSEEVEPLVYSTDINFRPVDLQFGPDGALYIVDWFNPLIGHMQYSLRDERRDTGHGRIWRIRHKERPLLEPPQIAGAEIAELLGLLESYEDRTRYRARRELRSRDREQVLGAIPSWLATQPQATQNPAANGDAITLSPDEHRKVEALWLHQSLDEPNPELLEAVLASPEPRARAAATRVLRFWRTQIGEPLQKLERMLDDAFPRVRLEALLGLSFFESDAAAVAALRALDHPQDYYLDYVLGETIDTLEPYWFPALSSGELLPQLPEHHLQYLLSRLATETLTELDRTSGVLKALVLREGIGAELAEAALAAFLEAQDAAPEQTLIDLFTEMYEANNADAGALVANELMKRPLAELRSLQARLALLDRASSRQKMPELGELLQSLLLTATDQTVDLAAKDVSPEATMRLLGAVARSPASARQRYFEQIRVLAEGVPRELQEQLQKPIERVRLTLRGPDYLRISEVELARAGANLATASASQSSTAYDAAASRAIDGDRSTFTFTTNDPEPWLEVQLEDSSPLDQIVIHAPPQIVAGRLPADRLTVTAFDAEATIYSFSGLSPARDRQLVIDPAIEVRRRATEAMALMPERRNEAVSTLIELSQEPAMARSALDAVSRIEPSIVLESLTEGQLGITLIESLSREIEALPVSDLTSESARAWFALASSLSDASDHSSSKALAAVLDERAIQEIVIRPIPHQMVFDILELTVTAGRPVELRLENDDIMPHNLVVTTPGGLEDVGEMAEAMARDNPSRAEARNYIPSFTSKVMFATPLVLPGQAASLAFTAPSTPGRYPFVCTFPGHWILMNGIINVVPEGVDVPPPVRRKTAPDQLSEISREFVEDWTLDQLQPAVEGSAQGRWASRDQIEAGRELFVEIGCDKCHQKQGAGEQVGPALDDIAERYNAVETLVHILEPSLLVEPEYETTLIETSDGGFYSGLEVESDEETVTLRANPLAPEELRVFDREEITELSTSPLSPMPSGLLVTLEEEEILNLLRYVRNTRPLDE